MQILLQNLRIVLSSLKIIGTHYHEATFNLHKKYINIYYFYTAGRAMMKD